jgi:hypothetical protein
MLQHDETRFPAGSEIFFMMLPFSIFITRDLSFYADVLGILTAAAIGALGVCSLILNEIKSLILSSLKIIC